jgi:hypothetical protein
LFTCDRVLDVERFSPFEQPESLFHDDSFCRGNETHR